MITLHNPEGPHAGRNPSALDIGTVTFPAVLIIVPHDVSLSSVYVLHEVGDLLADSEAAYMHAHLQSERDLEDPRHLPAARVLPWLAHEAAFALVLSRADWKNPALDDLKLPRKRLYWLAEQLGWY